jgi:hypothetical protein
MVSGMIKAGKSYKNHPVLLVAQNLYCYSLKNRQRFYDLLCMTVNYLRMRRKKHEKSIDSVYQQSRHH